MSEDPTNATVQPGGEANDPIATPAQPPPVISTPAVDENWKERYAGQQKAIQLAVEARQASEAQLLAKTSEIEQLSAQLSLKDQEKTIAVSERDKQLETLLGDNQSQVAELGRLKALELKLEVATEMGRPELMQIASHIPDITDKELLKNVMTDFGKFTDAQVKAREDQLMAGVSPTSVSSSAAPTKPQTVHDWQTLVDGLTHGSKERADALYLYGDFLGVQHETKI